MVELNVTLDMTRVSLRAGDAVLVRTQENLTPGDARLIAQEIANWLVRAGHPDVPVLFMDGGAELLVLNRTDEEPVSA